jgi:drug/metabolite transporter (DMT)-like permease
LKKKEDDTKALNQEQNNRKEKEAEMASNKKTPPPLDRYHLLLGFAFAISAAFLFAMSNVLMKKANFFNGSEKALVKLGIQLVVIILVLFYIKESFLGPKIARLYLFLRGLFGVGHFISLVYAVGLIAPSDLISLNRASIILVTIASRFVFKEKLNFTHILAIILTISGNKYNKRFINNL